MEFEGCRFFFLYSTVEVWSALDEYRIVSSSLLMLSRKKQPKKPPKQENFQKEDMKHE